MRTSPAVPRLRDVRHACQSIRAHWTNIERRERRLQAAAKQRKLMRWMVGAGGIADRLLSN